MIESRGLGFAVEELWPCEFLRTVMLADQTLLLVGFKFGCLPERGTCVRMRDIDLARYQALATGSIICERRQNGINTLISVCPTKG